MLPKPNGGLIEQIGGLAHKHLSSAGSADYACSGSKRYSAEQLAAKCTVGASDSGGKSRQLSEGVDAAEAALTFLFFCRSLPRGNVGPLPCQPSPHGNGSVICPLPIAACRVGGGSFEVAAASVT
jgi:hypothetical protein